MSWIEGRHSVPINSRLDLPPFPPSRIGGAYSSPSVNAYPGTPLTTSPLICLIWLLGTFFSLKALTSVDSLVNESTEEALSLTHPACSRHLM
ncbi:hypothetical protein BO71DRAFT_183253 [Aspergillus ellipticus CBS 707.79]|uniref:Uncharacterized protein n=1 Tax=Aspergillus ellipticus CBS 707.79 TaxID=1448320 RepID=A0A319DFM3_9EURO|nr:hypothetical protein BO71DRAFT_183253 [Aspergillus ellipticus CBS 707.79]